MRNEPEIGHVGAATTDRMASRLGFWAAILLAACTAVAFAIGIATPPRSGLFCTGICISYPYKDAIQFIPRDFLWMVPALLMTPLFVVLMACLHILTKHGSKVFSLIGLCLATMAATVVTLDYFVQIEVIAPSQLKGEADGVALFTQYNPHGIFIALEDLGYLILSTAFAFAALAIRHDSRLEKSIRWILLGSAILTIASFLWLSWHFGVNLDVRFELAAISFDWTALILLGILLAVQFHRETSGSAI